MLFRSLERLNISVGSIATYGHDLTSNALLQSDILAAMLSAGIYRLNTDAAHSKAPYGGI